MSLARILLYVAIGSFVLVGTASIAIVGWSRIAGRGPEPRSRLRNTLPYFAVLGGVLVANSRLRTVAHDLSWSVGLEITSVIYAIEGNIVPWIQTFASPYLTVVFSAAYIYGYVFLLAFPLVAYFTLEDDRPIRETCLAYSYNYVLGLGLYVFAIAYGPRNLLPELVESFMYTTWPETQLLTSQVNTNTNVFPSLHASLSTTVVILAYRTRRAYPTWLYLSSVLAVTILVSTMYLGIHWATDVLAGIGLGIASVAAAERWDPIQWVAGHIRRPDTDRPREAIGEFNDD